MTFLPETLTLKLIPILIFVIIQSREGLGADRTLIAGNVDGRFSFEDSNCPQSWKPKLDLEPELERPSLELWNKNGTKLLDRPSPTFIKMGDEYAAEDYFSLVMVIMTCRAPYPVILLAAYDNAQSKYGADDFYVTTTDIYNQSSYNFETQTEFHFSLIDTENNIFYCQAVENPCVKSREKLLYFYDKRAKAMTFTLRYFSLSSDFSDSHQYSTSDSNSNFPVSPNSSLILPSEFKSLFGTNSDFNLNLNQSSLNSSSEEYQNQNQGQNQNHVNNINDSDCEAFFYYEEFRDETDPYAEGRINLRYRCEFSDGTRGAVQVLRQCGSWGRCRFLMAARKQKQKARENNKDSHPSYFAAKNCWRPYIRGETCLNCIAQSFRLFITEPSIPRCIAFMDGDETRGRYARVATEEDDFPEKKDEAGGTGTDGHFEHVTSDGRIQHFGTDTEIEAHTENFEAATVTEPNWYDNYDTDDDDDDEKNDDKSPMSMSRSVEGMPLYVGFPPPGFQIQRPLIRTDVYDGDDLEEGTVVRMNPFPEIQLFNTTLQITCDSNEHYTSKFFIFALEFQSKAGKGKAAQTNLQFFPVDKRNWEQRDYGYGVLNSHTSTLHLNRTHISRVFCFAGVQNSYKWINASRPIRVLKYPDFYKPSQCLDENDKNLDSNSGPAQTGRPILFVFFVKTNSAGRKAIDEDHPQLFLNDGNIFSLMCFAYYPIQVLSTFKNTAGSGKFSDQRIFLDTFQNHSSYSFQLKGFAFKPKRGSHFYRCQSLENPCLHRSLFYTYVPGSTRQLKFEHVPQNDSDKSNSLSGLEFGSPADYPECQVLFFYKELEDFSGYEFRCEFPMEEGGTVNFHYCDSLNDCANLYRNRRQPKVCWRKVESWGKCEGCKESRSVGFRPFVATCKTYDYEDDESSVIESTFGNFAVFGLRNQTTGIAPIYFSNEDIDSKGTLFLEPFEKYQLFNTSLNVTCVSSAYYMSSEDIYIAKLYGARNELQIIKLLSPAKLDFSTWPIDKRWKNAPRYSYRKYRCISGRNGINT